MEQQLKELEIKPNKLAFQVALGFSVYTLVLIFLFKLMEIDTQDENMSAATRIISSVLSYVPFVMAVMYVQTKHRADLGGYMTFGRGFSAGFRVGANAGLFIGLLLVLYYKVLDPAALDHLIEVAIEKAGDNEKAIQGIKATVPYMPVFIAFGGAITYTVFGLVVSLIGAALFKKERPLDFN